MHEQCQDLVTRVKAIDDFTKLYQVHVDNATTRLDIYRAVFKEHADANLDLDKCRQTFETYKDTLSASERSVLPITDLSTLQCFPGAVASATDQLKKVTSEDAADEAEVAIEAAMNPIAQIKASIVASMKELKSRAERLEKDCCEGGQGCGEEGTSGRKRRLPRQRTNPLAPGVVVLAAVVPLVPMLALETAGAVLKLKLEFHLAGDLAV